MFICTKYIQSTYHYVNYEIKIKNFNVCEGEKKLILFINSKYWVNTYKCFNQTALYNVFNFK